MELKGYQKKVIDDLELYLEYVQEHKDFKKAFDLYWEDKIGRYNPLEGTGMQPYKNNVPHAVHVCIKVPTAGGKTFIALNALDSIFSFFDSTKPKAVVWLVPWSNLLQQTVKNLSDSDHPYRQKLNSLFAHRVEVYQKDDLLQGSNFNPSVIEEQLSIFVMSFASLRAKRKEDRKVYQENGSLQSFADYFKDDTLNLEETDSNALINVIRNLNPVIVLDESHNAESDLSIDMLKNLNPSLILDLTATPKENSNIVSLVPAIELKKENMVKLPVIVYNSQDKTEVINNALFLRQNLEIIAKQEEKKSGKYIRPIILFQAQSKTKEDNTTFEKIKSKLVEIGIPENQIKIKTANIDELKGIDLMDKSCEVRYIITINALKEGWDCPFAYILASLADKSSAVDVEQILGRVLRQPYVRKHDAFQLNLSYVMTASSKFNETLQSIVKSLQSAGFSENDYRKIEKIDTLTEEQKQQLEKETIDNFLFQEQNESKTEEDTSIEIDKDRISFDATSQNQTEEIITNSVLAEIEQTAKEEEEKMEEQIKEQEKNSTDETIYQEMGTKVKRYKVKETHQETLTKLKLPQFYLKVNSNNIFETGEALLNTESLLDDFRLSTEDTKISFEQLSSELYKIDLEQSNKNEYRPSFVKIEENFIKDKVAQLILAKPKEKQINDITFQLIKTIGNMYPIADQEIKLYIQRILENLDSEQLRDILARKYSYSDKIKAKIRSLSESYAEQKFNDYIKSKKVYVKENWSFPQHIIPKKVGSAIGNSLYEREASMNNFEEQIIMNIGSSSNIVFWHRNLEKGKGFFINGFKSNHYPDFILYTKSGKIILLETKGDHLDGTDSEAKSRLGIEWERQAGENFAYFMIFDKKEVEGSYNIQSAKKIISEM